MEYKLVVTEANEKVQTIYDAVQIMATQIPFWYTDNLGRRIEVEKVEMGEMVISKVGIIEFVQRDDVSIPIYLKASVDGEYLNGDGWYGFVNPPITVPDGTQHEEIVDGKIVKIDNLKIDPLASIFNLLIDIVGGN